MAPSFRLARRPKLPAGKLAGVEAWLLFPLGRRRQLFYRDIREHHYIRGCLRMRADGESDQDRASQLTAGMPEFPQWRALPGSGHGDRGALPHELELERSGTFDRKIDRVGIVALGIAELNPRHPVAVDHQIAVRGIGVRGLAEHDAGLAVIVSFRQEFGRSRDRKIARHLSP